MEERHFSDNLIQCGRLIATAITLENIAGNRADVDIRSVRVLEITGFGKRGKSQAILHRFQIAGKRPARSHGCPLLVDKRR